MAGTTANPMAYSEHWSAPDTHNLHGRPLDKGQVFLADKAQPPEG